MTHPKCFDGESQYLAWCALAKATGIPKRPGSSELNYCRDCTVFHKKDMVAAKRCEHPGTLFIAIPEPQIGKFFPGFEIVGFEPTSAEARESLTCADRSRLETIEIPAPMPEPSPALVDLLQAIGEQNTALSALTAKAIAPGPESSQS